MNGRRETTPEATELADFGARMREFREERGLSLADLHLCTHISKGHLGNLEQGKRQPSPEIALTIDRALYAQGELAALAGAARRTRAHHRARPAELPAARHFVGRVRQLDLLQQARQRASLITIDGPAGVGKTALAVRWAHDIAKHYPDGILYTDLRGYAIDQPIEPVVALGRMLNSVGIGPSAMPNTLDERTALLRTQLEGTRTLMVLDNAATAEQVRPLLPGSSTCLVVVTSRSRLSGLSVRDGAVRVTLRPMSLDDALVLLRGMVGARVDDEPDAASTLARQCGLLPLTLRIAAERVALLENMTLAELSEQLSPARRRLDLLATEDESSAARDVLSWSYKALAPKTARLFRLIGLHPTDGVTTEAAAALVGTSRDEAQQQMDALAAIHLIEPVTTNRYSVHDLVRDYATDLALAHEPEPERHAAIHRAVSFYLHSAHAAAHLLWPHRALPAVHAAEDAAEPLAFTTKHEAMQWCETELLTLAAATAAGTKRKLDEAVFLPVALNDFLYHRHPWQLWKPVVQDAKDLAQQLGHGHAHATLTHILGNAYLDLQQNEEALASYQQALSTREDLGDHAGQAWSHLGLGRTHDVLGDHPSARLHLEEARRLFSSVGDQWGYAITTSYFSEACRDRGQIEEALEHVTAALEVFEQIGERQSAGCALKKIASYQRDQGNVDQAMQALNRALAAFADSDDLWGQADTLRTLGQLHLDRGDLEDAHASWNAAADLLSDVNEPSAAEMRHRLLDTLRANETVPPRPTPRETP
ncbi:MULTISPECIES: tetratricopeptide repeat protein [unclassified Crossiella]|uniref:ATP-binding protein n=1 Tax=unclassified Crossiella TaxID=2620835 RepID=UPI001FFE803A|nr:MULTISPECIES: helix-turn-helix domain-containing protein [unclassified Crossiella]MCK2239752.1 tetratricopeptide repeat protein [Crossiella sp. S99.2]MCK2252447.1 tetratricopeptide repeat protein [Crossiella sp. S99.1]